MDRPRGAGQKQRRFAPSIRICMVLSRRESEALSPTSGGMPTPREPMQAGVPEGSAMRGFSILAQTGQSDRLDARGNPTIRVGIPATFIYRIAIQKEVTNAKSRARPARRPARVPERGAGLSIEAGA